MKSVRIEPLPGSPTESSVAAFLVFIDHSAWEPEVARAGDELIRHRVGEVTHIDAATLRPHEERLREWIRSSLGDLPEQGRLYLVQDDVLRPLDLASMVPTAFTPCRLRWGLTPIFDDGDIRRQLALAQGRRAFVPSNVYVTKAVSPRAVRDDPTKGDEHAMEVALRLAEAAGAHVRRVSTVEGIRKCLWEAEHSSAVHVLIAHSSAHGKITVGESFEVFPPVPRQRVSLPCELDLSICRMSPTAKGLPHPFVLSSRGKIWLHAVANVHCELWTSTFRERNGAPRYDESGFTYTEALVQARSIVDLRSRHGEDLIFELWDKAFG